jgi:hypothetical protein
VAPKLIIVKDREAAQNWAVYHGSLGATKAVYLDTSAKNDTIQDTGITQHLLQQYLVLAQIQEQVAQQMTTSPTALPKSKATASSAAMSGNGTPTDGPFVYLGFRPAFVLIKNYAGGSETNWIMRDSARSPYNKVLPSIYANTTAAEINNFDMDFLSNGFKIKDDNAVFNENGSDYLFIAFAENPFGGDGVSPATAR